MRKITLPNECEIEIPETADDFDLYTTQPEAAEAAADLTKVVEEACCRLFMARGNEKKIGEIVRGVYARMWHWREQGAADTEPRCVIADAFDRVERGLGDYL